MQQATIAAMQQGMRAAQAAASGKTGAPPTSAFNAPGFNPAAASAPNAAAAPGAAVNPLADPAMWWNMLQPQASQDTAPAAPKKK
jgi:hypothetical protein